MEVVPLEASISQDPFYRHAAHCMVWARSTAEVLKAYPERAIIPMQMRFDGCIGFPGGLVDEPVSGLPADRALGVIADAVSRELVEEMKASKNTVKKGDYVFTMKNNKKKLYCHFFAVEMTLKDIQALEKNVLKADEFGDEVMGVFRATLYTMYDGYRGFPAFLNNNLMPEARQQLLAVLELKKIFTREEIDRAVKASQGDAALKLNVF